MTSTPWSTLLRMHSIPRVPCSPQERERYRQLLQTSVKAREHAYTPNSHYNVGGAVIGGSGEVYTGANMDFTGNVDHAEQAAMARAFAAENGDQKPQSDAVGRRWIPWAQLVARCWKVDPEYCPTCL